MGDAELGALDNKVERKGNSPNLDDIHLSLSVVGRGDPSATINSSWNGNENGFNSAADPQTHKLRSSSSDRPTDRPASRRPRNHYVEEDGMENAVT